MDVAVLDYGVGNLHSLAKALRRGGWSVRVEGDAARATDAGALVLPGVGAFAAAASALQAQRPAIRRALARGLPCLGICLGMQLLFETSDEGAGTGLGVMRGRVRRLRARRVPHMGWNDVQASDDPLFQGVSGMLAYFANSYVVEPERSTDVIAWTQYGTQRFPAAVRRQRTWGVQFHPEKSGDAGLRLIENFLELAG
jgi:imidazole glycerol-phosphate synthase subunit HisH